jgi:hypothetical protein
MPDMSGPDSCESNENNSNLILVEYKSIREDILKRVELRQQILSITLTLTAAFLSAGIIQRNIAGDTIDAIAFTSIALVYPPIATCLALGWAQHNWKIRELEENLDSIMNKKFALIKTIIEQSPSRGNLSNSWTHRWLNSIVFSHGGVFLCSQILTIFIGCSAFTWDNLSYFLRGGFTCNGLQWTLLWIDIGFLALTIFILYTVKPIRN